MVLQALDGPILFLLISVGLIFALSGLFFIFKRKNEENAARIELFGLKFQSSSAGTLVLLIGAFFLLIPLFAPKAPADKAVESEQTTAVTLQETTTSTLADGSSTRQQAVLLPASAEAEESEPNDQVTQSNQFRLGYGVKGALDRTRDDFNDWYVVDISQSGADDFTVKIRTPGGYCEAYVYDQNEEEIDSVSCNQNGGSKSLDVYSKDDDMLFIKVTYSITVGALTNYELFVSQK